MAKTLTQEFTKGLWAEIPPFRLVLGLCPTLAITNTVENAYGLEEDWFVKISMDPTRMYDAVADGQVDLIVAYSSDGRTRKLPTLSDPEWALPPYHALLLLSRKAAANEALVSALKPLVGAIPQRAIVDANAWVDRDKQTAARAAARSRPAPGAMPGSSKTTACKSPALICRLSWSSSVDKKDLTPR